MVTKPIVQSSKRENFILCGCTVSRHEIKTEWGAVLRHEIKTAYEV